jgi:two-component system phosphate regulon sensor histidine kinase PhoR
MNGPWVEIGTRWAAGVAAIAGVIGAEAAGAPLIWQAAIGAACLLAAGLALPLRPEEPARAPRDPAAGGRALEPALGRAALERLPNALLLIDAAGTIEYANPAARALFERLRVGEHYSMSFRAPDFLDAIGEAVAGGGALSFEFTLHGDRSRVIQAHVDGAALRRRGGDAGDRHAICLFRDRTRDLRLARMRTDFIANASHELRTPLSSIRGFIETLLGPARDDAEARDRFLQIIQSQTERMQRLVDDLLSLNRIELNEHVAPTELQDLGGIARETAEALAPMADERDARIALHLPEPGPQVRGDRDQLIQAIGNLVENALKYGGGGPVELSLEPPSADHPGMVGLTVRDHGEGIPREHIPRLTERFYRVSVKRSRDQGGTGLGLAIVKHILSRHRGELSIESTPGEGSRFTLWLPREAGAAESAAGGARREEAVEAARRS